MDDKTFRVRSEGVKLLNFSWSKLCLDMDLSVSNSISSLDGISFQEIGDQSQLYTLP